MSQLTQELFNQVVERLSNKALLYSSHSGKPSQEAISEARTFEGYVSEVKFNQLKQSDLDTYDYGDDFTNLSSYIADLIVGSRKFEFQHDISEHISFNWF